MLPHVGKNDTYTEPSSVFTIQKLIQRSLSQTPLALFEDVTLLMLLYSPYAASGNHAMYALLNLDLVRFGRDEDVSR